MGREDSPRRIGASPDEKGGSCVGKGHGLKRRRVTAYLLMILQSCSSNNCKCPQTQAVFLILMNPATSLMRRGHGWPAACPPLAPGWPVEQVVLVDGCLVFAALEEVAVRQVNVVERKQQ